MSFFASMASKMSPSVSSIDYCGCTLYRQVTKRIEQSGETQQMQRQNRRKQQLYVVSLFVYLPGRKSHCHRLI